RMASARPEKGQNTAAGKGQERSADDDGGAARHGRAVRILAPESLADADGGCGGNTERNHVGERHGVERDLMRGERNGAEARDERGDGGKDPALERELHGRGNAERDEAADASEVHVYGSLEQLSAVLVVVPEK